MSQEAKGERPDPGPGSANPTNGPEPGEASWPGPSGLGGPGSEELPVPRYPGGEEAPAGSGADPAKDDASRPDLGQREVGQPEAPRSEPTRSEPALSGPDEADSTTGPGPEEMTETEQTIRAGQAVEEARLKQAAGDGIFGAGGEAARQRDEYLDALLRLQAEFDNYRKRMQRQQREIVENAATNLVKKLLPVLDTADLALAHGGGEDVKQVAGALFEILSKEGLERIDPEGQPFDPAHHDAVAHEPAEGQGAPEAPEVSEVLRAGYLWKGQVLRPAMVKVRG